jgi:hypothetical protein
MIRIENYYRFVIMDYRINNLNQNEKYINYVVSYLASQFSLPKKNNNYIFIIILVNFAAGTDPVVY